jgi:MFS family permease
VVTLTCSALFVDVLFYSALAPLLPGIERRLSLSAAQAGVLVGVYVLGTMTAMLPSLLLATHAGVKATLVLGLLLLAAASAGFGVAQSYEALLVTPFVLGAAGSAIWIGTLAWLMNTAPSGRRGEILGFAYGASAAGNVGGPLLGGIANAVGRAYTFAAAGLLALLMTLATLLIAAPRNDSSGRTSVGVALIRGIRARRCGGLLRVWASLPARWSRLGTRCLIGRSGSC